jgi:Ca-activated chloride channel family protein
MNFHWPHAFWLLLIPLALLVRDLLRRRAVAADTHPKITRAEATHSSLVLGRSAFTGGGAPRLRILFYLGLAAATAALARPQWGRLEEPVFDQAREIIIALDLSRSMLTPDVKPDRLERARLLITSLLERLKGERVGLIVFSGTAFLQSPLSSDYEILREFLPVLNPDYLPEGGTNYDALLETTLAAFGASGAADRFLIVLSDGEAQDDAWRKHLGDLKAKGIRVLGLGVGTDAGAMIPDGSGGFVKDERGAVVLSRLTGTTLRELADRTDGAYSDASAWVDLAQLVQTTVEQGRRGEFKETSRGRLAERFQWPLAAALACLLLSFWREFPVRPKPRDIPLTLASAAKTVAPALLLLLALLPSPASAAEPAAQPSALSAPVTQVVGRLAAADSAGARDYADLARSTVTFGERTRASSQPVPEGAVRDALAAVDAGAPLDPKAADWPALREQLEALLPKKDPPQSKPDSSKPDEKKPEQNKQDQSPNQNQPGQKGDGSQQPKQDPDDKSQSDPAKPDDQKSGGGQSSDSRPPASGTDRKTDSPGQSAFGDMKNDPAKPPRPEKPAGDGSPADASRPPAGEMQQVGGTPTEASKDPARQDPNLAIPLQKLDQVKQGDSPARLFQLLQGPPSDKPAPKGKDW